MNTMKSLLFAKKTVFTVLLLANGFARGEAVQEKTDDEISDRLVSQYIQSMGEDVIVFDASNIKQYWVDNSVVSRNGSFEILLSPQEKDGYKSVPLSLQLDNVVETQDCTVSIITEEPDVSLNISARGADSLGVSFQENDFLNYRIVSTKFHLEDTDNFAFSINFQSKVKSYLRIKKLLLSFSQNEKSSFLGSSGFKSLLEQFKNDGINVPKSDVQYILLEKYNKILIKLPKEVALKYKFSYHVYPVDKSLLSTYEAQNGFDFKNLDFYLKDKKKMIIPKPFSMDDECIIIQIKFPSYQYTRLDIGQFDAPTMKKIWKINISPTQNKQD